MTLQDLLNQLVKTGTDIANHVGVTQEIDDAISTLQDVSQEIQDAEHNEFLTGILSSIESWFTKKK
jgi:hypothetical protein